MIFCLRVTLGAIGLAGLVLSGCAAPDEGDRNGTAGDSKPWTRTHRQPPLEPAEPAADADGRQDADRVLSGWPAKPREAARAMIEKYGSPDEVAPSHLHWYRKGPWSETVVSREEVPHHWPKPHTDLLEQAIPYRVPPDKFDELAAFDGSVIAERTKGTLSARCDKEEMNFLALNLAHDVVTGKRGVEEARRFYEETAAAFMKGEKPPYTQKLMFEVGKEKTGDPDEARMKP
jgi:hypothetical protein